MPTTVGSVNFVTLVGFITSVYEIEEEALCFTVQEGLARWEKRLGRGKGEGARKHAVHFPLGHPVTKELEDVARAGRRVMIQGKLEWSKYGKFGGWCKIIGRAVVWLDATGIRGEQMVMTFDGVERLFIPPSLKAERPKFKSKKKKVVAVVDVAPPKDWEPW